MSKYPVIKITLFYCTGISIQEIFNFSINFLIYFSVAVFIITIVSVLLINKYKKPILPIFGIYLISIIVGAFSLSLQKFETAKYPFEKVKISNSNIEGKIEKINLINNKKLSLLLDLNKINSFDLNKLSHKIFLCNFWKDTTSAVNDIYENAKIGNSIRFVGTIVRPRNRRNPGEFDYENYLSTKGIAGIINCYKFDEFKIVNNNENYYSQFVFKIRKNIDKKIKEIYPEQYADFLKGVLLADRSDIGYEIKSSFVNSGVIHVLAVSGLHVGFISLIIFVLLGRLNIKLRYVLTIFGIIIFLIINGGYPSVFRASIMAILFLISKLTERNTNGFNSLAIAAFIILILNPMEILNPGFLLSFSAVLSILIFYPIFKKQIYKWKIGTSVRKIILFASVSLAAQIGTLPFTLYYFNNLSIVSLFANIIVIPLLGIIVAAGIISLLFSLIYLPVAIIISQANIFIISFIIYFTNLLSSISFSHISIFSFSIFDGIIFYLTLAALLLIIRKTESIKRITFLISLISISFLAFRLDNKSLLPNNELTIFSIDVGQGDSFLVKFPNNKIALIDAGNSTEYFDNGERIIYPLLQRLGIEKIDYAFISHLDSDHFGGIIFLINEEIVDTVFRPKIKQNIKDIVFENYLSSKSIPHFFYNDSSFSIGKVQICYLNDTTKLNSFGSDLNDQSGIIKITYGDNSFLFTGDAGYRMEDYLIENYRKKLESDVLKIGHHGSISSTSDRFLEVVNPKIALVSVGVMNRFHHPSKKVIGKLKRKNIEVRRTDKEGAIILASDGNKIRNINWRDF